MRVRVIATHRVGVRRGWESPKAPVWALEVGETAGFRDPAVSVAAGPSPAASGCAAAQSSPSEKTNNPLPEAAATYWVPSTA